MKAMYGINSAVITPFDKTGAIDYPALKAHVDFLIGSGVHGLYPLGTTGEAMSLSVTERKQVAERVIEYADSRVNVFIHVGTLIPSEAQELARHAHQAGAAGIGAVTPYYYGVNQSEMYTFYKDLAASVPNDFPVYIYNLPSCSTNDILPDTIVELAKISNISGMKNTMGDLARLTRILRKVPKDFVVIMGEDATLMPSLAMGAKGSVSGMSNMFPELFVSMYNSMVSGDLATAAREQMKIDAIFEIMDGTIKPCYMKAVIQMRGFAKSYARPPLQAECDPALYEKFQTQLRKLFQDIPFSGKSGG